MSFFDSLIGATPYLAPVAERARLRGEQEKEDAVKRRLAQQQSDDRSLTNLLRIRQAGGSVVPAGADPSQALSRMTAGNTLRSIGATSGGALGIPSFEAPDLYGKPDLAKVGDQNILFDPGQSPDARLDRRQSLAQLALDRRAQAAQQAAGELETRRETARANAPRNPVVTVQNGKRIYTEPSKAIGQEAPTPPPRTQGNGMNTQRVLTLQGHFNTDQTVKDAQQVATAFQKIKGAATGPHTPTNDMSLVYGLMKMQDPNSTVREGEYATAENAANVPARVRDAYNLAIRNHLLPEETRQQFLQTAGSIAHAQQSVFQGTLKRYSDQATRNGVDPRDVVYDPYEGLFGEAAPVAGGRGGGRGGSSQSTGNINLGASDDPEFDALMSKAKKRKTP